MNSVMQIVSFLACIKLSSCQAAAASEETMDFGGIDS